MESVNSEEGRRLYQLQNERDEVERQKERICEQLRELTNKYLTAVAAVHSARRLIGIYDDPEDPEACGEVYHFAVKGPPKHTQLEILDTGEIPDHVEDAIEAVEENEDQCAPGCWRREETAVAAITVEEKVVFRVSDQESLERLHEEAKEKRQQLRAEVQNSYEEFEELERELNRHDGFVSKVLRGEVESNEQTPTPEARRELRGIAEKHTDEVKAVRDYLDGLPDHVSAGSRTAAFGSAFPDEEARTVYERFRRRWQRADHLSFPETVEQLHEECKIALKLRDEFRVESP